MKISKEFEKYIEENGWVLVCESPLELEHSDSNSFASGIAAEMILDELDLEMCNEHNEALRENQEPVKTKLKRYDDFEEGDFSHNTKYRIIVPTEKDKEELMEAFEIIHYSEIDTDIIAINQLVHEYHERNSIIVDEDLYKKLLKS